MIGPVHALFVDDEREIQEMWLRALPRMGAFEAFACGSGAEALAFIERQQVDVVVTDVHMPGMSGFELTEHIKIQQPDLEVIVLTGLAEYEGAMRAGRSGAHAYLPKTGGLASQVEAITQAARATRLNRRNRRIRSQTNERVSSRSAAMRPVQRMLEHFAPTDHPILLLGPNGVGKSRLAREIHRRSGRADRPFLTLDGGQRAPGVWGSLINGHLRGAFTGAVDDRPGIFEEASGGTVFLDEIGDIPLDQQSALLRVLQERRVQRIGSGRDVEVDFRLISATNQDIRALIEAGRFRRDLYHRLKVEEVRVPALAERREDIPDLVRAFMDRTDCVRITPAAMRALVGFHWPGNVRELENVVIRAGVLAGDVIDTMHLPAGLGGHQPELVDSAPLVDCELPWKLAVGDAERAVRAHYLRTLLERFDGNLSQAARAAGLDRANFRRYVRRYLPDWQR